MLKVIAKHQQHARRIDPAYVPLDLLAAAREVWDEASNLGTAFGFRNSQTTVLAPTGTIAFMMDCDTTGVEPDIALVKYKKLVGGGVLKIVNSTVPQALRRLGYDNPAITNIVDFIDRNETIEGTSTLKPEHLPVFDCAFKPAGGTRSIHHMGHLRMIGAVQPFISGAISKTINMPPESTVEDITEAYLTAWKLGVKAVAIYRDGCKRTQPLNTAKPSAPAAAEAPEPDYRPVRRRLPADCRSLRHKFDIAGHEGYIHVGFYDDGSPGEIFIKMAKEGSTVSGLMDTIGILTSMTLQYGVPLEALVQKFSHVRYEPAGFTKNPDIPMAKSLTDYIFRFLGSRFLNREQRTTLGLGGTQAGENTGTGPAGDRQDSTGSTRPPAVSFTPQADAPSCSDCGWIMVRNGSCYKCLNCGSTSGCS